MKALIIISVFLLISQTNYNFSDNRNKIYNTDFDRCTIANESTGTISKFEIDLYCCGIDDIYQNPYNPEIKSVLWLSLISKNSSEITEGVYRFSSMRVDERKPMTFNGEFSSQNVKTEISEGKIMTSKHGDKIKILYKLILKDGNTLKGSYYGDAIYIHGKASPHN